MIDIKLLEKEGFDSYRTDFQNRGGEEGLIAKLLELNLIRKRKITEFEAKRAEQNKVTLQIAQLKRAGSPAVAELEAMKSLSQEIKSLEVAMVESESAVLELAMNLPNRLHKSVPIGRSAEFNAVVRSVGEPAQFHFNPKDHVALGEALGQMDFERAGKVSGARFVILHKNIAKLERALINFMLDLHTETHGYTETLPPFIVNERSLFGTGQLPKFRQELFHLSDTDYFLIPTAEVPVTNYFRGETLDADQLPISYCSYTPCFRSEAGSYGKDTKGLIRQHQFDKVELVKFVHPDQSYEQHDLLLSHAEKVLQILELPYRVMNLCSGDIGFGAAKCYDIEVWLPSQGTYREISSCSNFEDFQARRAEIRFKEKGGKPQFVHTINGSGLAIGRTLIAIMENYQTESGGIALPKALKKYMGEKTFL